jgi:hypothetical protein
MAAKRELVPVGRIAQSIHLLRGQKVILDSDLAALYGVTTGNFNKAVARNRDRFPSDFCFRLRREEAKGLIFQIGISKSRGGRRHLPYAFTEQGVAMLSSVLNSPRVGERTRRACWRCRLRHRELGLLCGRLGLGVYPRQGFSAGRRKQHARRVCSPIRSRR